MSGAVIRITGRAVAKDDAHLAGAAAADSFFVAPWTSLAEKWKSTSFHIPIFWCTIGRLLDNFRR